MHECEIAHLDLKLENVLIHEDFTIKVNDFDLSQRTTDTNIIGGGTMNYRAPEIVSKICTNFKAADIFSLGVILFNLVNGIPCFSEDPQFNLPYDMVVKNSQNYWTKYALKYSKNPEAINEAFKKLIEMMLAENPDDRPSLNELLELPYLTENLMSHEEYLEACWAENWRVKKVLISPNLDALSKILPFWDLFRDKFVCVCMRGLIIINGACEAVQFTRLIYWAFFLKKKNGSYL